MFFKGQALEVKVYVDDRSRLNSTMFRCACRTTTIMSVLMFFLIQW